MIVPGMLVCNSCLISVSMFIVAKALLISCKALNTWLRLMASIDIMGELVCF